MRDKQSDRSALWDTKIRAFKTSSLSLKEWCASNEISYVTFCYHMIKQNREMLET